MSTPTDPGMIFDARENTAKLPKWATELIYDLRKALGDWKAYAEATRQDANPGSTVVLDYYSSEPIGLPPHDPIYFCDPTERDHKDRQDALLSVRWKEDRRTLDVSTLTGEPLLALPVASNLIRVMSVPRDLRGRIW